MIAKGGSSVSKAYIGSAEVEKMYLGETLVYGSTVDDTDYLALTASAASTIGVTGDYAYSLEYSTDRASWNTFDANTTVSLASGETAYFRGINSRLGSSTTVYTNFTMTGSLAASGNIMSLLYGKEISGKTTIPNTYCFEYLFNGCTALTSASQLKLPATTLKTYCYYHMFYGCTGLVDAPVLPAMTMLNYCYNSMFYGCTSLAEAPELPATTITSNCYYNMFYNCSAMTKAPSVLPGTTAGASCYRAMFRGCSKLTTAPKIMYTGASANYSQREMFYGCTKLNWCMYLGTDISASNSMYRWMYNVQTTSGILVKNINATWTTTGVSGTPTNWTVIYYDPDSGKYYTDQTKETECDDHGQVV